MDFNEWNKEAIVKNQFPFNLDGNREIWEFPNGVQAIYTVILPRFIFKKAWDWTVLDLVAKDTENNNKLVEKYGGVLVPDYYQEDGVNNMEFEFCKNGSNSLRMAYNFIMAEKDNIDYTSDLLV